MEPSPDRQDEKYNKYYALLRKTMTEVDYSPSGVCKHPEQKTPSLSFNISDCPYYT
jgi:hypothetical protein